MKKLYLFLVTIGIFFFTTDQVFAQVMPSGNYMMQNQVSVTPSEGDLQDINTGKDLFLKLQNKQLTCSNLQDDDFEKIGEYIMNVQFGENTSSHIQMNERIKQMMGDQGEERMHTAIGRSVMNCNLSNQQGGVNNMMGNWNWNGSMMSGNWFGAFSIFAVLFLLVGLVDLILLGIFLWKKIGKS